MKYVNSRQTFVELSMLLAKLPSRRVEFFNFLTRVTGLPPNTIKMVLCTTPSGATLSASLMKKVAIAMNLPIEQLFPQERLSPESLVSIYAQQSYRPLEYDELIKDVRQAADASRQAVISWMYGRHYPRPHSQRAIASLLEQPIKILFPQK